MQRCMYLPDDHLSSSTVAQRIVTEKSYSLWRQRIYVCSYSLPQSNLVQPDSLQLLSYSFFLPTSLSLIIIDIIISSFLHHVQVGPKQLFFGPEHYSFRFGSWWPTGYKPTAWKIRPINSSRIYSQEWSPIGGWWWTYTFQNRWAQHILAGYVFLQQLSDVIC